MSRRSIPPNEELEYPGVMTPGFVSGQETLAAPQKNVRYGGDYLRLKTTRTQIRHPTEATVRATSKTMN